MRSYKVMTAPGPARSRARSRWKFWLLIGFLAACALWGASSRTDSLALIPLRLASIGALAAFLLNPDAARLRAVRVPLLVIGGFALLMLCQLVPLPPGLWRALPGRAMFAAIAEAAEVSRAWRPLSFAPDLTVNSALALLPPAAALVGCSSIDTDQRRSLFLYLPVLGLASALVGIVQSYTGSLYFYITKSVNDPIGLFANRNHQALFLAAMLPLLAQRWETTHRKGRAALPSLLLTAGVALLLMVEVLVVGSRAGLFLLAISILLSGLRLSITMRRRLSPRTLGILLLSAVVIALSTFLAVHLAGRDQAFERLFIVDETVDQRYTMLPTVLKMTWDLFPAGAGFGTFDWVFRAWEPDAWLSLLHYNHAHNDFIELVYEGGLPALLLAVGFGWWMVKRWVAALRDPVENGFAVSSSIVMMLVLLSSLVDYPLRAPLLSVLFALCTSCLGSDVRRRGPIEVPRNH